MMKNSDFLKSKINKNISYDNYIIHNMVATLLDVVLRFIHNVYIWCSKDTVKFVFECVVFILFLVTMYFAVLVMCAMSNSCASYYGMMGGL